MPRYAEDSFEQLVYRQLIEESTDEQPARSYVDPDGERVVFRGTTGVSFGDRMRAIKAMCRTHELGWVNDQNAVEIIHNISKGE